MSYDLNFWRYRQGIVLDHKSVHSLLCEDETVEGLEELPIAQMLGRIAALLSDWTRLGPHILDGGDRGVVELYTTPQSLHVVCRGVRASDMNRIIAIAADFACPLYDPQIDRRFDAPSRECGGGNLARTYDTRVTASMRTEDRTAPPGDVQ